MDIEEIFKKAIQPYEARVQELQEADKKKELEIRELKAAILELHRIAADYNAHNVQAPAPGKKTDGAKNPTRPQTAVLPKTTKPEKPEGKVDKSSVEKKPSNNSKSEKEVKAPAKDEKAKKPAPAKKVEKKEDANPPKPAKKPSIIKKEEDKKEEKKEEPEPQKPVEEVKPEVKEPEVKEPEVKEPEVKEPEVKEPEVKNEVKEEVSQPHANGEESHVEKVEP